jgi:hypothetical protein
MISEGLQICHPCCIVRPGIDYKGTTWCWLVNYLCVTCRIFPRCDVNREKSDVMTSFGLIDRSAVFCVIMQQDAHWLAGRISATILFRLLLRCRRLGLIVKSQNQSSRAFSIQPRLRPRRWYCMPHVIQSWYNLVLLRVIKSDIYSNKRLCVYEHPEMRKCCLHLSNLIILRPVTVEKP